MTYSAVERNRDLIRSLFETVINAHDPERADDFYRSDYVQHNPDVAPGLAGVKQLLALLNQAFPDLRGEVLMTLAEQDRVMVLVDWSGTHLGPFAGQPASARKVRFRTAEIFRIEEGLIAEHWDVVDNTQMQLAVGLLARCRPGF